MEQNNLMPIEGERIRKIEYNGEWYYSIIDVIEVLTDSNDPKQYWKRLNQRDEQLKGAVQIVPLLYKTIGGNQKIITANTEGVLRIVMSIPSPKAEPLKMWLAEQGKRAIDEAENPALSFERMTEIYKAKGYTDEWIQRRIQTIQTRKELTDEWKNRGVTEQKDYSILTATIAKGTFGLTPSEHKDLKGLDKPNQELRDHMTPLELIFTALGEELTKVQAIKEDAQGYNENLDAAIKGGEIAGKAVKTVESAQGIKIVSKDNYLLKGNAPKELPESDNKE